MTLSKAGELREPRPVKAEGNPQPSTMNGMRVIVTVQRLSGDQPRNKPELAPATSIDRGDDIVHARRNAGTTCNGYVASMSTGFTLKGVQKAFGSAWFGSEHVDLIVSDQNSWDSLWNKLQPQQRFMNEGSDVAKIGFGNASPLDCLI